MTHESACSTFHPQPVVLADSRPSRRLPSPSGSRGCSATSVQEFPKSDIGYVGVFVVMLPLARHLGNITDMVDWLPLGNYLKWAERNLNRSGLDDKFTPKEYVGSHLVLLALGLILPLILLLSFPASRPRT